MVSRRDQRLKLPLGRRQADGVCRRAVAELGWGLSEAGGGTLVVSEDATRLHCNCSPLRAELVLDAANAGETTLAIHGSVPGLGPIASQRVRRQTDLLTRRIGLAALRTKERGCARQITS